MPRFLIPFLTPLENIPRLDSLRILTNTWKRHQGFNYPDDKPAVSFIDKTLYLEAGNHRAIWFWLNNIEYIDAELIDLTKLTKESLERTRRVNKNIMKKNLELGVYSPADLAKRIKESQQYVCKINYP